MNKKFNYFVIVSGYLISISLFACSTVDNSEIVENSIKVEQDILNEKIAVSSPAFWSSLITDRSYGVETTEEAPSTRVSFDPQIDPIYPATDKYYFSIFEDQYPNSGDYDLNDIIVKHQVTITKTSYFENETLIIDGWQGYIDSWLLNDGASYHFKVGLMFYVNDNKYENSKLKRLLNSKIKIGLGTIDLSQVADDHYTGDNISNTPWMVDLEDMYGSGCSGDEDNSTFHCYTPAVCGERIFFQVSNLALEENQKLWISLFIYVEETGEHILISGYDDIESMEPFEMNSTKYQYNTGTDTDPKYLPFGLEFVGSSFTAQKESESIALDSDFVSWVNSGTTPNWYDE